MRSVISPYGFGKHWSWVISHVPMFHITQPWSVYGLLDGYYFWWCPIYPSHGTLTNPCWWLVLCQYLGFLQKSTGNLLLLSWHDTPGTYSLMCPFPLWESYSHRMFRVFLPFLNPDLSLVKGWSPKNSEVNKSLENKKKWKMNKLSNNK